MLRTIASHLVFWTFMSVMTVLSTVFVVFVYFPFVALKALWLAASGRIHEAIGPRSTTTSHEVRS